MHITFGKSAFIRRRRIDHKKMVSRAQELIDLTDAEKRGFTDAEQLEFDNCCSTAQRLGMQVTDAMASRTRAIKEFENGFGKPEVFNMKMMKRADYDKLHPTQQAAYIKSGGKLEN